MKRLLLLSILLFVGCEATVQQTVDPVRKSSDEKMQEMIGKKIANIRLDKDISGDSVDIVTEDGSIITFYGYAVNNGGYKIKAFVGAK